MKTPQNLEPSIDDEISIADVINFFSSHKKMILILAIIGAILGSLFGKFSEPIYEGSALYSPSKISGVFVVSPTKILTMLNMNNFYSKETFANCNADFYKDYGMSNKVKGSISKDLEFIQLHMQDKNKTVIKDCLNSVVGDIKANENKIIGPYIQFKNNELRLAEEKIKKSLEFKSKLNGIRIKELETNGNNILVNLTILEVLSNIEYGQIKTEINNINTELLLEETKVGDKVLPINTKKKSSLSPKLGALLGLFLGLSLGILLALKKKI